VIDQPNPGDYPVSYSLLVDALGGPTVQVPGGTGSFDNIVELA
jgi:hypothetical protein